MAFTGTPVVKLVSERIVRLTGLSLAADASGTISLAQGAGDVLLPTHFNPKPYGSIGGDSDEAVVTLQDSIQVSLESDGTIPAPAAGSASMFFGTTTGTGSTQNDYAATVAVGDPVPFPQDGPAAGGAVTRSTADTFLVNTTGDYVVSWQVGITEASQLELAVNGVAVANTCATSGAGTQQNTNTVEVSLVAGDLVTLINPAGNAAALTVTPADGSLTHAQAPNIVFQAAGGGSGGTGEIETVKTGSLNTNFLITLTNNGTVASGALEIYVRFH